MAEIAISQIIKMTIAVLVIVLVIAGVTLAFKNYIIPYFTEEEQERPELPQTFLDELVTEQNRVCLVYTAGDQFISVRTKDTSTYTKSNFYVYKNKEIYLVQEGWWIFGRDWTSADEKVGDIGKDAKITIIPDKMKLNDNLNTLGVINGAYKVGAGIYRIGGFKDIK